MRHRDDDYEYDLFGGMPPHQNSDTSFEAAERIRPNVKRLQATVFNALKAAGGRGLTDEEGYTRTRMADNTWRPRRGELVINGLVEDSGHRRPTKSGRKAIVWVLRVPRT